MPNVIDSTGLTIQTYDEIVAEILNGTSDFPGFYAIYGADINVDPNSPDGQMVGIFAQGKLDVLEFLQQIFNSFDPDKAVGVALTREVQPEPIVIVGIALAELTVQSGRHWRWGGGGGRGSGGQVQQTLVDLNRNTPGHRLAEGTAGGTKPKG